MVKWLASVSRDVRLALPRMYTSMPTVVRESKPFKLVIWALLAIERMPPTLWTLSAKAQVGGCLVGMISFQEERQPERLQQNVTVKHPHVFDRFL